MRLYPTFRPEMEAPAAIRRGGCSPPKEGKDIPQSLGKFAENSKAWGSIAPFYPWNELAYLRAALNPLLHLLSEHPTWFSAR